jgi:hypothetical protein
MLGITHRIKTDKITIESHLIDPPEWADWKWQANWFQVTLKMGKRKFETEFGMGIGHSRDPDVYDVMTCLTSDASSIENARSFEEWADDFGMDHDAKTRELYVRAQKQTFKLRGFLRDKYTAYIYDTEDDG